MNSRPNVNRCKAYAVTKAAQVHLIKCLAGVVGPKVRVNCVSPGILMTVCRPILAFSGMEADCDG